MIVQNKKESEWLLVTTQVFLNYSVDSEYQRYYEICHTVKMSQQSTVYLTGSRNDNYPTTYKIRGHTQQTTQKGSL